MWSRIAPLALLLVLATPSVAAAQALGCDTSDCGEVLPSTTTTAPGPTTTTTAAPTSTSLGLPAQVEAPEPTAPGQAAPAPTGGLPVTGSDLVVLAVAGLGAIALGAGLRRGSAR